MSGCLSHGSFVGSSAWPLSLMAKGGVIRPPAGPRSLRALRLNSTVKGSKELLRELRSVQRCCERGSLPPNLSR
jgi:hypothetical protein